MGYVPLKSKSKVYNFNYQWHFKFADAFPLKEALARNTDKNGRNFFEPDYDEQDWQQVSVPHTFNDKELFSKRVEDGGAGQTRSFFLYRKWFEIPSEYKGNKVLIEFEGIRQSCYLYVNGRLVGFYENGVAPFGFDLTAYVNYDGKNLIAIATDNTATRNVPFCMAETPNKPDAEIGAYLSELEPGTVPEDKKGVGFFWNCNDFNPSVGGLTKNIRMHFKSKVYLTLPLYTNLQTCGTYIFADNFDFENNAADINVWAEVRNETEKNVKAEIEFVAVNHKNEITARAVSKPHDIKNAHLPEIPPLTITPEDAYVKIDGHYRPAEDETMLAPTAVEPVEVQTVRFSKRAEGLEFWSVKNPYLYTVYVNLIVDGEVEDSISIVTGFRETGYDNMKGVMINREHVWLTGYAQRASNEWAAVGAPVDWLRQFDAELIRKSNANHIRWMHVAACPADIRACDRLGIVCTQPAGDKERENFGRQWHQRTELMRDVIIYFRNSPSIFFWEAGNNAIGKEHMRQMRILREKLDPCGGRYMGCRTLSQKEVVDEAEYVGTMLNRHAGRFQSEKMPILETEYSREESPRRVWDDFSPPDYDYDNVWVGKAGVKKVGRDVYDLTAEDFALSTARGYSEFFNDRAGGASGKNLYSAAAALCWSDSVQHGRQSASENARMSGRVDGARVKKQNFDVYRVMQSDKPSVKILGHWNYPDEGGENYKYKLKRFNGEYWEETGEYAYRNPHSKTVYVVGSYAVKRIELYINGGKVGECDKPINTFIFEFHDIDITKHGRIEAKAYDYNGKLAAADVIRTVKEPHNIKLTIHTGKNGFIADGSDIAFLDVEVTDENGEVCPLCFDRIDFSVEGNAVFLGGYNSGKYDGYGKSDSVIHKNYVFAECGTNRVFLRSLTQGGHIKLTAKMHGIAESAAEFDSVSADTSALSPQEINMYDSAKPDGINHFAFDAIDEADRVKYKPDDKIYCKVLINGSEADTHGTRVIYEQGTVWGPIIYVLERIERDYKGVVEHTYDAAEAKLTVKSGGHTVVLRKGYTHMILDGEENLMSGEPYVEDNVFICEISAVTAFINGINAGYDDAVNLYRLEL